MEFAASLDSLPLMMEFLRNQAIAFSVPLLLIRKMELVCEEAIVNIISYAYQEKKGTITIECERKGMRFEITLRDDGVPFNPIEADINPQLNTPVQERKIGGMGIYLIRKTIDEVGYQRVGDENILRMAFNLP